MVPNIKEGRMGLPRICSRQWIDPECPLISHDIVTTHPHKEKDRVLGDCTTCHLATPDLTVSTKGYGGLVIKPDAIKKGQVGIIMDKINNSITNFGGRIVVNKTVKPITEQHIETMYPSLEGNDLIDAKGHLVGDEMIILIIESSDISTSEMFKRLNEIKGQSLVERSYERLLEGRILDGGLRDLLPVPGEEGQYFALLPTIMAKKVNSSVYFPKDEYAYYAQNLVHSPDNEEELMALFKLADFYTV